ncbi:MAG: SRPBCC family protein, partial [Bdellovibrionota bacterium]
MKWLLIIPAALILFVGAIAVVGSFLPKAHTASRSAVIAAPPAEVFRTITDFQALPSWRPSVKRAELTPGGFRETSSHGEVPFRVETSEPDTRLVTRIADPNLPFGGSWTYFLRPTAGGTELQITENGEVYHPIFRFMSRFVFSQSATIEG